MTARYLNYKHAAAYLDMPEGTLRTLVRRKAVPHCRIGRDVAIFTRADLDAWRAAGSLPRPFGGNTSDVHEDAILRLVPYALRVGFPAAVRKLTGVDPGVIVPDAFAIDEITQCVDLFEVEHRHTLTRRKMVKLRDLSARLASVGWTLRLFCAAVSSPGWTEIDVDAEALAVAEIARMVQTNHVRFEVP